MFQETTMYRYETLLKRLREEAFLNAGVRITLTDERPESDRPQEEKSEENELRTETMCYEGGIRSFVSYLCERRDLTPLTPQVIGRSRTHDSFCAGNRRNPCKTLVFRVL